VRLHARWRHAQTGTSHRRQRCRGWRQRRHSELHRRWRSGATRGQARTDGTERTSSAATTTARLIEFVLRPLFVGHQHQTQRLVCDLMRQLHSAGGIKRPAALAAPHHRQVQSALQTAELSTCKRRSKLKQKKSEYRRSVGNVIGCVLEICGQTAPTERFAVCSHTQTTNESRSAKRKVAKEDGAYPQHRVLTGSSSKCGTPSTNGHCSAAATRVSNSSDCICNTNKDQSAFMYCNRE
jgi:hypothetical protein